MKRYHTETEKIANEAFDRAILDGSRIYVNGQEWREGDAPPELPAGLPERPYQERWGVASIQAQEDFWSHLPRAQPEPSIDWRRVRVYFALFGLSVGALIAIAIGIREMWEAFR